QYPLPATHLTPPKPTKPFILGYSVIAIVLHFSAWQSLFSCLCSNTASLLASNSVDFSDDMSTVPLEQGYD
ncbi:unnamed protein product, partial [marine sediment metagenome]